MSSTVIREQQQVAAAQDELGRPVYHDARAVPRDLRSAAELARGGYQKFGPVVAWLEVPPHHPGIETALRRATPDGLGRVARRVGLHSTSEARRLMGFAWSWPRRETGSDARRSQSDHPRRGKAPGSTGGDRRKIVSGHTPRISRARRRPTLGRDPQSWLSQLFREGFVVIDTETTGLSARDEIIEIAAVDADGQVLFESLVQPRSGRVPAASTRIHGLTFHDVATAPTWPDVVEQLTTAVAGHRLFAWNSSFDERMSVQSSRAWGVPHPLPGFECAMRAYAACRGIGSGSLRLERAAFVEGVALEHQSHRSADDARLTLAVLKCLRRSSAMA